MLGSWLREQFKRMPGEWLRGKAVDKAADLIAELLDHLGFYKWAAAVFAVAAGLIEYYEAQILRDPAVAGLFALSAAVLVGLLVLIISRIWITWTARRLTPSRRPPRRRGAREPEHKSPIPLIFSLTIILFVFVWFITSHKDSVPDSIPGFTATTYVRLYDTPEDRRRYIFEARNKKGARAAFYLSASGLFTFSLTDIRGEMYQMEIPIGSEGIPIDRYIFLYCAAGVSRTASYLQVFVDGKEVKRRLYDFPIEFGGKDDLTWERLTFGADNQGKNNAPFKVAMLAFGRQTLTIKQIKSMNNAVGRYLVDVDSPIAPRPK
jgi:hypothetical protein